MNVDQCSALARVLGGMTHSPLGNYIIPGLTSSLVGGSDRGTVRVFECSRDHEENVVPHSHRFDFGCFVVRGCVRNRLWRRATPGYGDTYRTSTLTYSGAPGEYQVKPGDYAAWQAEETSYGPGDVYTMTADQVHSIWFTRGALVVFFEGPTKTDKSLVLEPVVDGAPIPTFRTEPWMFSRGTK